MTMNLVGHSLIRAVSAKRLSGELIHHSDRGSQYSSQEYGKLLDLFNVRTSMSGKGNCFDNGPMESFWGTLKTELVFHREYETRQEGLREVTEYIELFHNRQRRQEKFGYRSPTAFEQQNY